MAPLHERDAPLRDESYLNDAVRRQLQRDRSGVLLAKMDAESGPVSDALMEAARKTGRPAAPKGQPTFST